MACIAIFFWLLNKFILYIVKCIILINVIFWLQISSMNYIIYTIYTTHSYNALCFLPNTYVLSNGIEYTTVIKHSFMSIHSTLFSISHLLTNPLPNLLPITDSVCVANLSLTPPSVFRLFRLKWYG